MHALYLLSVWIHILAVTLWLGGMAFLALVLVPLLRRPEQRERAADLVSQIGVRFRPIGWICLGLLVLTGTVNLWFRGALVPALSQVAFWETPFGRPLAVKLLAVVGVLLLSAVHDFRIGPRAAARWKAGLDSDETRRDRRLAGRLGRANMFLGLLAAALGVILVRGWAF